MGALLAMSREYTQDAVAGLRATGAVWSQLRHAWAQTVSVQDSGPRSPLTVQAVSVASRMGRLACDNTDWSPQAGPGRPRAAGELLVPELFDALCVTISTLAREAATIAVNHARLITDGGLDLYSADRAHRPEGESRRFFPLQPAQRAELAGGYRLATGASEATAAALAPMSRGYQALKAAAAASPPQHSLRQNVEHACQQALRDQQPYGGRSIVRWK